MGHRAAAILFAPLLLGAAPQTAPSPAAAVECQLSLEDARAAVAAMTITRSSGEDPAGTGGLRQFFSPGGVTILGQSATDFMLTDSIEDGTRHVIIRADVAAPYQTMRTAILALHGKTSCDASESNDPAKLSCIVHVRTEGPGNQRDVDMFLFEYPDRTNALGCMYSQKQ